MSFVGCIKDSRGWRWLAGLQRVLLVVTSAFVVLIMCVSVLLRYVFKSDLFGLEEVVVIAAFWLYFIGSSFGVYERSHVKADIIPQLLQPKAKMLLNVVIQFIVTILCVLFTIWAFDMVLYSIEWMPRTSGLRIPMFVAQSSILVGYFFMSFYSIIYFFDDLLSTLAFIKEGDDSKEKKQDGDDNAV